MQASYEAEGVKARLESLREDLAEARNFKMELETRLVQPLLAEEKKKVVDVVQECQELYTKYPAQYE